ncbi:hypothetical protein ACFY93_07550 [Streptomyces sp. NPDC008313]|uniref:hypothetical protein n=1 Tax=Streptomyces sp. NPDC008313 TaxID=3364826 RepID=UPI0036E98832
MLLAEGGTATVGAWIALATALLGVVAGVLGLPPLYARLREQRLAPGSTGRPGLLLPSRVRMVDRTKEVAQLLDHLGRGEYVIAIEGSIGVGKSALAMEVAHRLAERRTKSRRTPGAHEWLVWIDAHNELLSLADIARTLSFVSGDQFLAAAPAEHKGEALQSFLAAHPCVLVIDNLRLTAVGAEKVIHFLRNLPSGSLAVVSANTLGQLEAPRVLLSELRFEHMRELLCFEADRRDVAALKDVDNALARRLYKVLGGNPRVVKLFVLAYSRGQYASVDALLDSLAAGAVSLTDGLFGTVWADITPQGRGVLAICAYLDGKATAEQVQAGLGLSESDLRLLIEQLWSDGLLSTRRYLDQSWYSCSAALCGFVLSQTPAADIATMRRRLADHLTTRFQSDWEDAAGAMSHVEAMRILLKDLDRHGEYQACVDLFAVALDLLFTLGLFDDRIELGWVSYHAATELNQPEERSLALSVVSSTHAIRGEDTDAAAAVRLGLQIARDAGSDKEVARQLRCEGFRLFRAGRAQEALAAVLDEDAEALAREAGDMNNAIDIQSLKGAAYWHLGDLPRCEAEVRRFVSACEELPWERGKAYAIRDLAEIVLMRGAYANADALVAQAQDIATEYRDTRQLARITLTQARLRLFQGKMREARTLAQNAARQSRDLVLLGEAAEAEAVAKAAARAVWDPMRRMRTVGHPKARFTEFTVGGD